MFIKKLLNKYNNYEPKTILGQFLQLCVFHKLTKLIVSTALIITSAFTFNYSNPDSLLETISIYGIAIGFIYPIYFFIRGIIEGTIDMIKSARD